MELLKWRITLTLKKNQRCVVGTERSGRLCSRLSLCALSAIQCLRKRSNFINTGNNFIGCCPPLDPFWSHHPNPSAKSCVHHYFLFIIHIFSLHLLLRCFPHASCRAATSAPHDRTTLSSASSTFSSLLASRFLSFLFLLCIFFTASSLLFPAMVSSFGFNLVLFSNTVICLQLIGSSSLMVSINLLLPLLTACNVTGGTLILTLLFE